MTSTTKPTSGITHIALAATDLLRATAWHAALFGSSPVLDDDVEAGAAHLWITSS